MTLPEKPKGTWNPLTTFDASPAEIEAARKRQVIAARNKIAFRRATLDPQSLLAQGKGGNYLDYGLQRWYSGRQMFTEFFHINNKNLAYFMGGLVIPITALYFIGAKSRKTQDERANANLRSKAERGHKAFLF